MCTPWYVHCRLPDVGVDQTDMLTATQVACEAELCNAEAMCTDTGTSEVVASCEVGLPMQDQHWQEVVYRVYILSFQAAHSTMICPACKPQTCTVAASCLACEVYIQHIADHTQWQMCVTPILSLHEHTQRIMCRLSSMLCKAWLQKTCTACQ